MPVLVSALVYYLLGALWFSRFMFERHWDHALGFERPRGWRPSPAYYLAPLLMCGCVMFATYLWVGMSHSTSWQRITGIGFHVGILVSLPVTLTNAVQPKMSNPWLFTAVVGTYHVVGVTLASAVMAWMMP